MAQPTTVLYESGGLPDTAAGWRRQCVITYMNSERESRNPMWTWTSAAEGNCVAVKRGGEQPEAELRAETKVNPIRCEQGVSPLDR